MGDDNGGVLDRIRPTLPKKFSIEAMLKAEAAKPGEAMPPALQAGDEAIASMPTAACPYEACSRADLGPLPTLTFLLADQRREGFSYSDLRRIQLVPSAEPGSGPELVLRFVEAEISEVRLTGRNLDVLYEQIGRHVISWVRQLPPRWDFLPLEGNSTIVNNINICKI